MSRLLLLVILSCSGVQLAPAQNFPKFPQQAHVTTGEHVKNTWTRILQWQARHTRSASARSDKQSLIKNIEAGHFDDYAELVAQRSNLKYLKFHNRMIGAQRAEKKIAALEAQLFAPAPAPVAVAPVAQRREPMDRAPGQAVVHVHDESVVYEEDDCPPEYLEQDRTPEELCIMPPAPRVRPQIQRPSIHRSQDHRPSRPPSINPPNRPSPPATRFKPSPPVSKPSAVPTPRIHRSSPSPSPQSSPTPSSPPSRPRPIPVAPPSFRGER